MRVLESLKEQFDAKIVEHQSKVHPDFHFIELYLDKPGLEEEIANMVKAILGTVHVKVDWIDTSR